jgi:hypothetical protein
MPDDATVFDSKKLICTKTPVPDAGGDNHVPVSADGMGDFPAFDAAGFMQVFGPGQQQTCVRSDDQILQVQNNQTTKVQGAVVLESVENIIHIKAAQKITIEVGKSKLEMSADGTITLTGERISVLGKNLLTDAAEVSTIKGGKVEINP